MPNEADKNRPVVAIEYDAGLLTIPVQGPPGTPPRVVRVSAPRVVVVRR